MSGFLIHIHTGPENPIKAALGLPCCSSRAEGRACGGSVPRGDGVFLLGVDALRTIEGKGTGNLNSHFEAIRDRGGRFYLSGMSAKARGLDAAVLDGKPAEFALPDILVKLAAAADVVLTY